MSKTRVGAAGLALVLAALIAGLDLYLKGLVEHTLPLNGSLPIFPPVLELRYTRNTGAAFGLLSHAPAWVVLSISLVVLAIFLVLIWPHLTSRLGMTAVALVVGGALGNILDRVLYAAVRDYIHFNFWAIFNLADACVVIGVALLMLTLLRDMRVTPSEGAGVISNS